MLIIHGATKPAKKQNRKPGWQKAEAEYAAWLAKHGVSKGIATGRSSSKATTLQANTPKSATALSERPRSMLALTPPAPSTKVTPELLYKDSPEMLERERKARERKFTTAPVYNKGGDVLITDEMMKDILSGATRRRP
jgi:hypothetical protein